ncbi:MAG: acyl-CoA dehydrogenase family protein [Sphingomonas sp.]
MNFDLVDDQRALVDTVEKFAASAGAKRLDGISADAAAAGVVARWRGMAELGLAGLVISADDGGVGMTMADAILVCEALGCSLAQEPFITAAVVGPKLIEMRAVGDIRSAQLLAISDGSVRIAVASEEGLLDFDSTKLTTRVDAHGDVLRLSGTKELVIDGMTATHFVVTALLGGQEPNVFLVPADQPGITSTPLRGLNGGWLAQVVFDRVEVCAPLFDGSTGLAHLGRALDHGIVALCAEALGLMNRMLTLTANYLQTRHQFGKAIGTFQALQHRFAEMVVAAEQSRSVTYMAAAALANDDPLVRRRDVSAAKSMVGRHGRTVLESAIQLHGGIGITHEYELSRYVRRMLEIEKTWGDTADHEIRFAKLNAQSPVFGAL